MQKDMPPSDLKIRTKKFALSIIKVYPLLPRTEVGRILGRQLLRSGTSVGAQYREAQRAKSNADFISKCEGTLQELEETGYWVELIIDSNTLEFSRISDIEKECGELIAIFVTIVKRVKSRRDDDKKS